MDEEDVTAEDEEDEAEEPADAGGAGDDGVSRALASSERDVIFRGFPVTSSEIRDRKNNFLFLFPFDFSVWANLEPFLLAPHFNFWTPPLHHPDLMLSVLTPASSGAGVGVAIEQRVRVLERLLSDHNTDRESDRVTIARLRTQVSMAEDKLRAHEQKITLLLKEQDLERMRTADAIRELVQRQTALEARINECVRNIHAVRVYGKETKAVLQDVVAASVVVPGTSTSGGGTSVLISSSIAGVEGNGPASVQGLMSVQTRISGLEAKLVEQQQRLREQMERSATDIQSLRSQVDRNRVEEVRARAQQHESLEAVKDVFQSELKSALADFHTQMLAHHAQSFSLFKAETDQLRNQFLMHLTTASSSAGRSINNNGGGSGASTSRRHVSNKNNNVGDGDDGDEVAVRLAQLERRVSALSYGNDNRTNVSSHSGWFALARKHACRLTNTHAYARISPHTQSPM